MPAAENQPDHGHSLPSGTYQDVASTGEAQCFRCEPKGRGQLEFTAEGNRSSTLALVLHQSFCPRSPFVLTMREASHLVQQRTPHPVQSSSRAHGSSMPRLLPSGSWVATDSLVVTACTEFPLLNVVTIDEDKGYSTVNDRSESGLRILDSSWHVNIVAGTLVKLFCISLFLLFASAQFAHNVGEKCQRSWGKEASVSGDESHWYTRLASLHTLRC